MATALANKLAYIVNPAILELRGDPLSTLSGSSTNALERLAALTVDTLVDQVLCTYPWNGLMKRSSSLTAYTGRTSDEFDYLYLLPTDYVNLIPPIRFGSELIHYKDGTQPYRVMELDTTTGQLILECLYSDPDILYVYKTALTDEATDTYYAYLPREVLDCIVALCKSRWAYQATGDKGLQAMEYQVYKDKLKDARGVNMKRNPVPIVESNRLVHVRSYD